MVFASLREQAASGFFLRARTVIRYVLRAASTLENTYGEQQELRKFCANRNFVFVLKREAFFFSFFFKLSG